MSRKFKNIEVGQRFGRLKFIKDLHTIRVKQNTTIRIALFQCDCGNEKEIAVHNVLYGRTKSCGCLSKTHNGNTTPTERKIKSKEIVEQGMFDADEYFKSDWIF